jgi:transcription elongation factor Elf1
MLLIKCLFCKSEDLRVKIDWNLNRDIIYCGSCYRDLFISKYEVRK